MIEPLPLSSLPPLPPLRLAVVGHVEVVSFVRVEHLPRSGEILHASGHEQLPAGGGAVVAVQMARLTGRPVAFITALGRDREGERARQDLEDLGLEMHVAWRDAPTRRAVTFTEATGERTITVIGERLAPAAGDDLGWEQFPGCDGVFVTAADAPLLRRARAARVLAATPRVRLAVLQRAGVLLDALIGSGNDPGEAWRREDLTVPPRWGIRTDGRRGGLVSPGGRFAAVAGPERVGDTYGAGDSFAAGVTVGLTAGWPLRQALSLGCHCGAACVAGFGPYATQLRFAA